jgi:hypothetical protein
MCPQGMYCSTSRRKYIDHHFRKYNPRIDSWVIFFYTLLLKSASVFYKGEFRNKLIPSRDIVHVTSVKMLKGTTEEKRASCWDKSPFKCFFIVVHGGDEARKNALKQILQGYFGGVTRALFTLFVFRTRSLLIRGSRLALASQYYGFPLPKGMLYYFNPPRPTELNLFRYPAEEL